jgi:hypothetical protein
MSSKKVIVTSTTLSALTLFLQQEAANAKPVLQGLIISGNGDGALQFFGSNSAANPLTNIFYISDHQTVTLNLRQFNIRATDSLYYQASGFTEFSFTLIYENDYSTNN